MMKEYEILVNEIRNEMINNFNYERALKLCKKYIALLNNENKSHDDLNDDYYVGYFNMGYNYKKLGKFNEAIKSLLKAKGYIEEDMFDFRYANILMLLANCYEKLNLIDEVKKLYNVCIRIYEMNNMIESKLGILFNIAKLDNDIPSLEQIILDFEEIIVNDDNINSEIYNNKKQNENTLNQMRVELEQIKLNTYFRNIRMGA